MAEGGVSIKGSDAFFDYNCSDCLSRKNAHTEAIFYCPQCNKYLCRQCYVCDHDVIGRRNVDKWGKPSTRLQFDPCPSHKGNAIQLYCKKHDVVCCPVCAQTDHKLCGELQYIPLVASTKGNTTSLMNVKKDLQELQTKAEKVGKDRTSRLAGLDNTEQQLLEDVNQHRADVDTWLNKLQQQSQQEIRQYKSILTERYISEVSVCDNVTTEVASLRKKLDAASKDEALLFSRLKQGTEQVKHKKHLISDIASSEITYTARFEPHTNIEQQVKSLHGLGELLTDPLISKFKPLGLGNVKKSQGQGLGSQPVPMNQPYKVQSKARSQGQGLGSQPVPMNQPYTVKSKTSFNVKASQEKKTCDIWGMCQMPDGSIIVADGANKSLKQLDSTYKVTSHCSLTDRPYDECPTEAGQVAVALKGQTIQLVSVGATMTRKKSFSTDHDCLGLAYSNNSLFVTTGYGGTTIHVYNLSGTRIRTIDKDQRGNQLFTNPFYIVVSPDGARLHITDSTGLVTVDNTGNLIARFTSPDLKDGGCAVCVDRSDNVFVGGCRSDNVLQLEKGERQLAKILSPSDKILPRALCFDGVNLRLLVSVSAYSDHGGDTVHVLHFSK